MWSKVTQWTRDPQANRDARRWLWIVLGLVVVVNVISLIAALLR